MTVVKTPLVHTAEIAKEHSEKSPWPCGRSEGIPGAKQKVILALRLERGNKRSIDSTAMDRGGLARCCPFPPPSISNTAKIGQI